MSPQAGELLLKVIAPRIKAVVRRGIAKYGSEDDEEVIQDTIVQAARQLDRVERRKPMAAWLAGSVAWYSLQHAKCGRRFAGAGRTDVLAPRTQLMGRSSAVSLDHVLYVDEAGTS